ncbi:MAG: ATP-binding protein, partial [Desulfobacteraceae bacterium]|nr:ATP-binding protein [Desulfobacteraceae bacterium]
MLEGDLKRPFGFVGRSKELTRLKQEWLPRGKSPVALIQGLAGMGKTMLAAEVIHLWHDRFDYVFAFQSRPYQISAEEFSAEKFSAEEFYRDLDLRLSMASKLYREKCRDDEYRKICLPTEEITGEQRYETMRNNLADALHSERILLVADNFETHLLGDGACKDLEWKNLLDVFCNRLGNSGSCVLITSRHVPADLKDQGVWIPMGPLPLNQARLLIQNHDGLRGLWHNKDTRSVALRVLEISRGHPLILQRLGILAGDAGNLVQILDRLEKKGLKELPDLPDMVLGAKTDKERETEREYLEDVAVGAVDVLLERIGSDARLMLWVTTLAFEPVQAGLLVDIWENLVNESPASGPLLNELVESGLLQKQGQGKDAVYSFHELVRERMAEWMENHPQEQAGQDAKQVWLAYGQRYEAIFWALQQSGESGSREAATEMGRRA